MLEDVVAVICVAIATYLMRYLPLRCSGTMARGKHVMEVFAKLTVAVLASLTTLSALPYVQHDLSSSLAAVLGVSVSMIISRRTHNVGLAAAAGLLTYASIHEVLRMVFAAS